MHQKTFSRMTKHPHTEDRKFVESEFNRMGFNKESRWRISDINKDFELCNTYPKYIIIPSNFKDEDLISVAKFRYFGRIPTAVWRHTKNGCFIVRSSQPTVGWFGWFRSELDENLVQTYVKNTIQEQPQFSNSERTTDNDNNNHDEQKEKKSSDSNNDSQIVRDDVCSSVNHTVCEHPTLEEEKDYFAVGSNKVETRLRSIENANDHLKEVQNHNQDLNSDSNKKHVTVDNTVQSQINLVNGNQKNGDVDLLSDSLAKGAKITGSCQNKFTEDTSSTLNIGNGDSHFLNKNDTDSSNQMSAQPISTNSSDNPTTTSTPNDSTNNNNTTTANTAPAPQATTSKMLIIDARSYAAAMANRAKGGGCECSEYYQRCEVHFMNLANIHSIRKSYHAIRSVCEAYSEQSNNWVSFLDNSRWLHHISGLLKSALLVVDAIDIEEKSILIHCSDGWDRTPQLVALAEIMLDPYYRTFDGFRTLIQREWLDFGHKFADRCGSNPCNEDPNERCPVFLQWLDCIQQLLVQYPKHFEFNSYYLDKLNRHTYSNIFGTFSYNSNQERILSRIDDRMGSLWSYFDSARERYKNQDYNKSEDIVRPSFKVKDLHFWKEVYLPPINQPKNPQTPCIPTTTTASPITTTNTTSTTANIDNNKCSHDSLYIDGLTRTVCK